MMRPRPLMPKASANVSSIGDAVYLHCAHGQENSRSAVGAAEVEPPPARHPLARQPVAGRGLPVGRRVAGPRRSRGRRAPAGAARGPPASRSRRAVTAARLPPAESPATARRAGSAPSEAACSPSQRTTASASSTAAGNGCSGARRYSTLATTAPDALASARHTVSKPADGAQAPAAAVEVGHHAGDPASDGRAVRPHRHLAACPRHAQLQHVRDGLARTAQQRALRLVRGPRLEHGDHDAGRRRLGLHRVEQLPDLRVEHGPQRSATSAPSRFGATWR